VWYAPSKEVFFQGGQIDPANLVQFISPIQGAIYSSEQAIATALKIEDARYRNANTAIPSGILKQTGGEPLSGQELADLAAAFNAARLTNQTAALNEFLSYEATSATPDKMLLIESAQFSALQMAQICNIPPYLLGVPTGSYAYTNSRESRVDLWLYGTKTYAECIASTLSSNSVLPVGTYIEFDFEEYLGEIEEANTNREVINSDDDDDMASAKEIAEVVQKIYLGVVNGVITTDEAREIINKTGTNLPTNMDVSTTENEEQGTD
jgi:hypothetical protein